MKIRILDIFVGTLVLLLFISCTKSKGSLLVDDHPKDSFPGFVKYSIRAGHQYCDRSIFKQTNYTELKFVVRFDSSAIYQTSSAANQLDVNKLYGFSDNNDDHHRYSARFGWRWSDGALRLFAYTYNGGEMDFEELSAIGIGTEYSCSIKVMPGHYIFRINEYTKMMTRASTTTTAAGYLLYPYFGGDEAAPHDINIWIKEL